MPRSRRSRPFIPFTRGRSLATHRPPIRRSICLRVVAPSPRSSARMDAANSSYALGRSASAAGVKMYTALGQRRPGRQPARATTPSACSEAREFLTAARLRLKARARSSTVWPPCSRSDSMICPRISCIPSSGYTPEPRRVNCQHVEICREMKPAPIGVRGASRVEREVPQRCELLALRKQGALAGTTQGSCSPSGRNGFGRCTLGGEQLFSCPSSSRPWIADPLVVRN